MKIEYDKFKRWLESHKEFTNKTNSDILSRLKRADKILKWENNISYLFYLEQNAKFQVLSCSVRSQLRRAIKLYIEYLEMSK